MRYPVSALIIILLLLPAVQAAAAVAPYIDGPDMRVQDNNIIVSLSIDNASEIEKAVKSGLRKDIVFTVELIRAWRFWPDEFVVSKKIIKTVKYDNLRNQYRASVNNGYNTVDMYFKNHREMREWLFTAGSVNLANIKELDPSIYYIRTVVESRSSEQLPLIGVLMHFIPEVEMSLAKESEPFALGGGR